MTVQSSVQVPSAGSRLEPFSYFDGVASKIRGLGGSEPRPELSYGFHTHYVTAETGRCTFLVTFDGLSATTGILYLQVNMLLAVPGAKPQLAVVDRIPFVDIVAAGGRAAVRFQGLPGQSYALFGKVIEDTDAAATGLEVLLDRPGGNELQDVPAEEPGLPTERAVAVSRSDHISSVAAPEFRKLVSQAYTPDQLGDPAFQGWRSRFGPHAGGVMEEWKDAFILQAREAYAPESRSVLGIQQRDSAVPAILAASGVNLSLENMIPDGEDRPGLPYRSDIIANDLLDRSVAFEPMNMAASTERYDFVWSCDVIDRAASVADSFGIVLSLLERMNRGGVAVHIFQMVTDWALRPSSEPVELDGIGLRCPEIERLALNIVSERRSIAQIRFGLGDRTRISRHPFGLIIRG